MQYNSTYNIHNANLGLQTETERLKVQALMGWDKEFRNLKWYGLENGMSVVELGSGPGFFNNGLLNLSWLKPRDSYAKRFNERR